MPLEVKDSSLRFEQIIRKFGKAAGDDSRSCRLTYLGRIGIIEHRAIGQTLDGVELHLGWL